ncbi:anion permease [Modicisalibacter tunisiensis]|uniref:SLC13 family permease n=1 Tax=Modicisalibacter tunisiensis TaxID=390637 RepID=UPI001CCCB30E|nr:SLC13 family permease [Modicisalibacter tunisiensis]MBZ9539306.1 anion permease [Modicisalibacter tunisiensis]
MSAEPSRLSPRHLVSLTVIVAVGAFLLLAPGASDMVRAASVIVLAIALWATGWLPQWLTALAFFTLCTVAGVAPPDTVFAGFASAATWLVFSGLAIGAAIQHTGLGATVAARVGPHLQGSYAGAVSGVVALGLAMAFVMPSGMGRVVLLVPILITLADHLGYQEGRPGRTGVILGGILGTFLPTYAILPANVPNNVLMGAVEAVLGEPPTYSSYLLLHFPVLGALKTVLLVIVMLRLYPDRAPAPSAAAPDRATNGRTPLSRPERRLGLLLLLAVALWLSDAWHGISPAWIGLAIALVCLFPGSGLMADRPLKSLNVEPLIYVAGIVSLGALAHHSGLGERVAHYLLAVLPLSDTGDAATFGLLSGLAMTLGTFVTLPGVPAILTPMATELAAITGWSPDAVAMTQVVGFSTVLLPYQGPPLVVGLLAAGLRLRDAARVCLIMAAISLVLLWPLDYLWWQLLGWI